MTDLQDITYKYDIALSYGGRDGRGCAEKISRLLKGKNLEVYFDRNERTEYLSADLDEHTKKIYMDKSELCIIIWSIDHNTGNMPQKELAVIKSRVLSSTNQRNCVYLYPLDETPIPPFLEGVVHACSNSSLDDFCTEICRRLRPKPGCSSARIVGFENFEQQDKDCFLSLDCNKKQVTKVIEIIRNNFITLLSGDEQSGKTSLIKSGLVPSLEQQDNSNWKCIYTSFKNSTDSFSLSNLNRYFPELSEDIYFEEFINWIVTKYEDNGTKVLVIIDQFENLDAVNEHINLFLNKIRQNHNTYKAKISILISCQATCSRHIDLLEHKFKGCKFFTRHNISPLTSIDAQKYLHSSLQIMSEEEIYFEEMFSALKLVSRREFDKSSIISSSYLQIFGRWWLVSSEQSKMTSEKWSKQLLDTDVISGTIIVESYWLHLKNSEEESLDEIFSLYRTLKSSKAKNIRFLPIAQSSLNDMRFYVNELMMKELVKTVSKYWLNNLIKNLVSRTERIPASEVQNLIESLQKQSREEDKFKIIINAIYAKNEGLVAPQLSKTFFKSQSTLCNFLSDRNNNHEEISILIHIFLHYHFREDRVRYGEFHPPRPTPSSIIREFYTYVNSNNNH